MDFFFFSSPFFLRVLACGKGIGLSLNSHLQQPKFSVCLRPKPLDCLKPSPLSCLKPKTSPLACLKPKPLDSGVMPFPPTPPHTNTNCSRAPGFSFCFASGTKSWPSLSHGFNDTFKTMVLFCLSQLTCQGGTQLGH